MKALLVTIYLISGMVGWAIIAVAILSMAQGIPIDIPVDNRHYLYWALGLAFFGMNMFFYEFGRKNA